LSVYNKLLHEKELRLLGGILGAALMASAINLFIVPQGFYAGGAYGLCQVIRTLLVTRAGLSLPFDLAGLLYLLVNLPMFYLAYRGLGRTFFVKATIVTVCNSVFSALIPSPATPIIEDALTSCLIGGIGVGFAAGLVLSCGCSTGGLDILGLYLSKRNPKFTVGRFCICFNVCLYTLCLLLFNAATAIYSAIYNILSNLFLDRLHQQNVNVELLIFTKKNDPELPRFIMDKLDRGVTYWTAHGAYTGDEVQVLCVCLSKYEVGTLQQVMQEIDPKAFFIVQEGIRTGECPVRKKVSAVGTAEHGIAYDIRSTQRPHGQDIYRTPFAHVLDGQCLFERIQVFGVEDGRQGGTVHRTVGLHGILAHVARVGNLLGEYNYFQLFSH